MSSEPTGDRLAQIKGRHQYGYLDTLTERHLRNDDRAWLIGEVERLRERVAMFEAKYGAVHD